MAHASINSPKPDCIILTNAIYYQWLYILMYRSIMYCSVQYQTILYVTDYCQIQIMLFKFELAKLMVLIQMRTTIRSL